MRAPFDRIACIAAVEPEHRSRLGGTIGCLQSHIAAITKARQAGHTNVLVMEDDFSFTSDTEVHLDDLAAFLSRAYDYWVCLLGTSKYGVLERHDDLMDESFQACTNAEAYLLSRAGMDAVLPVYLKACEQLKLTRDTDGYAADRCWAVLQGNGKFLSFRRKFGFQIASVSDIEGGITCFFD
jgi:GR25 family glycosyltransferase involved in LPS biosynthesis